MRRKLVIGEVIFLAIMFVQKKLVRSLSGLVRNETYTTGFGATLWN